MAFATRPQHLQECFDELDKFLHEESIGILKEVFQKIEREFEVRRLNIVLGFFACLAVFLVVSDGAHFLCNFICFAFPAYVIISAVEQDSAHLNNKQWLTYWAFYNALSFVEIIFPNDYSFWMWYPLAKFVLLVHYFLPVSWNASEIQYNIRIHPFLQSHHTKITELALQAWEWSNKGAVVLVVLLYAYMWGFRFLCHILGFIYPAYISMVSLMNDSEMDNKYWLAYWTVYSACTLLESFLSTIPRFYPMKFIFLGIYMLEPTTKILLYQFGKNLILWYKPVESANRLCRNIVEFFLTPNEVSQGARVDQSERYSPGIPSLRNIALRKTQDNIIQAQQLMVDPQEVNLQLSSPVAQAVLEMDVDVELVTEAIRLRLARDGPGQSFSSTEDLLNAVLDLTSCIGLEEEGSAVDKIVYPDGVKNLLHIPRSIIIGGDSQNPLDVIEENRQLKDQRMCKICMTEEVEKVFVPCGHLVCCNNCATAMDTCPICRMAIKSSLRAYMS